jgi:hypothetical protein
MKSAIVSIFICVILFEACKKNTDALSPAQTIQGNYTAYKHKAFDSVNTYPINGKTITIQIDAIGEDSVRLKLISTQNGYFSPGDTVIDRHFFVQTLPGGVFPVAYQITLGEPVDDSATAENTIAFYKGYNSLYPIYAKNGLCGYYTFVPPDYHKGAVQTAFIKTQ